MNPPDPASYWQTARPPTIFAATIPHQIDVAVVGGGLLGAATAYWLARGGVSTVLIERTRLAYGATGRNGGFVSVGPAEGYPHAIARLGHQIARAVYQLTLENRLVLRELLAEERIDCDYREPGNLTLALGAGQLRELSTTASALEADGLEATLLDRSQVQQMINTPLHDDVAGGLFQPTTGLVHSARLVYGLASAARRYGAQLVTATVHHLESTGDQAYIHTDRGILQAGGVIIAANAWIPELIPALEGLIVPVRGQMLSYAPCPPVFSTGMNATITSTGEYWQQTPDGTIVLGGCRAAAVGLDIAPRDDQPSLEVQRCLETILPRLFPALRARTVTQRWGGLMAFTPDYVPIADRLPGTQSIWIVGGFCGHGMPFGMRLGQLLATSMVNGDPAEELAPLRLSRATLQKQAR